MLVWSGNQGLKVAKEFKKMRDQWLICDFVKGMFSDELAVEYRDKSFFILKQFVETMQPGRAKVRVRVFRDLDTTWAVLPTEDSTTIAVEQKDLIAA
jgi:hypothetical protein